MVVILPTKERIVRIYSSPLPILQNIAIHTRIETQDPDNTLHRYEIRHFLNKASPQWWYMHINHLQFGAWLPIFTRHNERLYQATLLHTIAWWEHSDAYQLAHLLKNNLAWFLYLHSYSSLPGPNCNTFVQMILDMFPHSAINLPSRAFWRHYHRIHEKNTARFDQPHPTPKISLTHTDRIKTIRKERTWT